MPHKFDAHPDHPAVAYLVRLHADIGGRIKEAQAEAERLAEGMKAVEAVIKMFNPDFNVAGIAVRRRVQGNPWFKRGTLFREALDVLRTATAPMTVTEIRTMVMAAKGITEATRKQVLGLEAGIRCALDNHAGKSVERVGEGVPKKWKIK